MVRVRARGKKRRAGSSPLAPQMETPARRSSEGASKRPRLDAAAPPAAALAGAQDRRMTAAWGSSSPELLAAAVKAEHVPTQAFGALEEGRGRGGSHGIPLSVTGARSSLEGGGRCQLMRSGPAEALEVRLVRDVWVVSGVIGMYVSSSARITLTPNCANDV